MALTKKLAKLIKKKTDLTYGLEITDSAIRLAAISRTGKSHVPKVLYEQAIDFTPESLHDINASKEVRGIFNHMISHYGVESVHVGIPERHFFFRCIQSPKLSGPGAQNVLHQIIDDYLTTQVTLPRSDVVCEYEIAAEEGDHWYVAVAVVPKFVIRKYFALLEMSRIKPITIEANIHAMNRACVEDLAEDLTMVVRMENNTAHVALVGGGSVVFDRDYVLPGGSKGLDFMNKEIVKFYRDWVSMPYRNKFERKPILGVTIFGGSNDLLDLKQKVGDSLRLPIRIQRPVTEHIEIHQEIPPVHSKELHRFSSAIGLALQGR